MIRNINKIYHTLFVLLGVLILSSCTEDEEVFERTRLFRPVLNEDLFSEGNSIIVNMGDMKQVVSYTIEVSRDTFATTDYIFEIDTNYMVINEELVGQSLFWNTLYQVRATAHAEDPQYDSKVADLGNVRTQRFPTILNIPESYDVIDIAARVTWTKAGAQVTGIKVFAPNDLRLEDPLLEKTVSSEEEAAGEAIITGLDPESEYQIAIYSDGTLRGWVNYTTLVADIDPNGAGVIDVRDNETASAVQDAVATAPDGAIVLVKRGITYDFPNVNLDKSITIRAAYGFGAQKATLYTTGNWDIADNSTIDHIRFIDLELRGEDIGGDYVFNPNRDDVNIGEILFENCKITTFRGIMRIRSTTAIDNYKIVDCVVDSIGGYGLLTADTDPGDPMTAHVNNIYIKNSTFSEITIGIQSRNNSKSIIIEDCTFHNFIETGGRFLRYRGGDGNNNVLNGISIVNSIFSQTWDQSETDDFGGVRNEGLGSTNVSIVNVYSTAGFNFSEGNELAGFPVGNYTGTAQDLWVNPDANDFNFGDTGFAGRYDTGDPRWRVQL